MQFVEGSFYHIYNRGNDKGKLFFEERNYAYFLQKVKKHIVSNSNLIAWCLMPNHFHFLIQANESTNKVVKETPLKINALTEGIRILLSSYSKGILKQERMTGNLFQQKTKFTCADEYLTTVFHYIHQNPFRAGLVTRFEDWPWSSFREYLGKTPDILSKIEIAYRNIDLDRDAFIKDSYSVIPDEFISKFPD